MEFIDLKKQYEVLKGEIDGRIAKVLHDGAFIGGEEVKEFAVALADYCGTKYCLTCGNGTDALTLALRCFDVKAGDAVFVPDFTFFASAETPALEGATCVFVDVDERTFNLDAVKLRAAIKKVIFEKKLRPKCIIAVDLFGQPADYPEIRKVADEFGMPIIEDGAQGFGGNIGGKRACSFGDISTTSFFPAKPLGCYGDGGAVFTDNEEHYKLMCSLAVHGKGEYKYDNVRLGYNSRLDTIQAAILLAKLGAFKEYELDCRNKVAAKYTALLDGKVETPLVPDGFLSSWAQYTVILRDGEQRRAVQSALKEHGVPSMVYYPIPLHAQKVFKNLPSDEKSLGVSTALAERVLSLPMHPYLTDEDIEHVCDVLRRAL